MGARVSRDAESATPDVEDVGNKVKQGAEDGTQVGGIQTNFDQILP